MQLTKEQLKERRDFIVKLMDDAIESGLTMTEFSLTRGTREVNTETYTKHEYDGSVSVSFSFGRESKDLE